LCPRHHAILHPTSECGIRFGAALRLTTNPPYNLKRREAKRRFDFYLT
jgi:hypothetical protein